MRSFLGSLFLILIALPVCAAVVSIDIKYGKITDGDTFSATYMALPMKIRALGIDTPESKNGVRLNTQATTYGFPTYAELLTVGKAAKTYSNNLLSKSDGICVEFDTVNQYIDTYGRYLPKVWLGSCAGPRNFTLQEELVREGLAFVDYRYQSDPFFAKLLTIQTDAKTNKKGIWKYSN